MKKLMTIIAGIIVMIFGSILAKHHFGNHIDHKARHENKEEMKAIDWTPATKRAMINEMISITENYQELVSNLAQGEWDKVIKNSHNIHSSFILKQELSEEDRHDLHRILPARFVEMDSKFHDDAIKLAMAAKKQDGELATFYSGKLMDGCVSCHQVYAKGRFEGFSNHAEAAHEH